MRQMSGQSLVFELLDEREICRVNKVSAVGKTGKSIIGCSSFDFGTVASSGSMPFVSVGSELELITVRSLRMPREARRFYLLETITNDVVE